MRGNCNFLNLISKKQNLTQLQLNAMKSKERIASEPLSILNHEKGAVLARMFRHTRMSYKYFWFLGLLECVTKNRSNSIPATQVLHEMAVCAWYPVCFYRLSLGAGDA